MYLWIHISRRNRGLIYCMLGLMMLIVAIGVTAGTAAQASQKGGLYILYIGKMKDISSTARIVPNHWNIISF